MKPITKRLGAACVAVVLLLSLVITRATAVAPYTVVAGGAK